MTTDLEILDMVERWDKEKGILAELKSLRALLEKRNYVEQPAVYRLVDILIRHFKMERAIEISRSFPCAKIDEDEDGERRR